MKAVVGETVVAEAASDAVVSVEGNAYFPPDSVVSGALRDNPFPYICGWKGRAQYYDVLADEAVVSGGAWSYPDIQESAVARVGCDFSGYVAFDQREIRIED